MVVIQNHSLNIRQGQNHWRRSPNLEYYLEFNHCHLDKKYGQRSYPQSYCISSIDLNILDYVKQLMTHGIQLSRYPVSSILHRGFYIVSQNDHQMFCMQVERTKRVEKSPTILQF